MDQIENVENNEMLMELTAEVVAAYVSNNSLPVSELPALISDIYGALGRTNSAPQAVSLSGLSRYPPMLSISLGLTGKPERVS